MLSKKRLTGTRSVFTILVPIFACLLVLYVLLVRQGTMQLLDPAGYVARLQSTILWGALVFAAICGGIVIATFFIVAFRYREETGHRYEPGWVATRPVQTLGWSLPLVFIIGISIMVWTTAHQVDPYQPINTSSVKPITIQVVALRWKWLFIYPSDQIATVNMMKIPVGTPVALQLTADAPMNAFWVPRLGNQVYAMTGMVTQLHLMAEKSGTYPGSSTEMSGGDFAGMNFTVQAVSTDDYALWKKLARRTSQSLDYASYAALAKPSSYNAPAVYALADQHLFHDIVMQFMVSRNNRVPSPHTPRMAT